MKNFLMDEESGQGMVEYALILALIAVACIAIFGALGKGINSKAENVNKALTGEAPAAGGAGGGAGTGDN